ncbi:F-box protein CPR1-like [Humulus lupulus]|uniref:F-box protein CPR1-like n=1 Tax=Humulus lupulus TaxID=3486 RepID=UPI002B4023C2|nr:F-box protein CPR1-like [Humulus lupulus]
MYAEKADKVEIRYMEIEGVSYASGLQGSKGFGYEPLTNDFKVVVACGDEQRRCCNYFKKGEHVAVYSLKSNSWKTPVMPDLCYSHGDGDDSTCLVSCPYNTVSVVISGSIHWLIYFGCRNVMPPILVDASYGVVAFDLTSEEFKLIKAPSSLRSANFAFISICNLCGCLSLVTSRSSSCIKIWVMKNYGVWDSWT